MNNKDGLAVSRIGNTEIINRISRCLVCNWKIRFYSRGDGGFCEVCSITTSENEKERLIQEYLEKWAKPWKDIESLFCDSEFLKTLINKEPAKGNECD